MAGQRKMFIDSLTAWASLPRRCKLIVTGRNDRIPETFGAVCCQVTLLTGADVNDHVNEDIRRFFEIRFAAFGQCLDSEMLRTQRVFERLTTRAAGLFIWANTVVRFIDEGIHEERLERVLNGGMGSGDDLTKLYQQILQSSFPRTRRLHDVGIPSCHGCRDSLKGPSTRGRSSVLHFRTKVIGEIDPQ